MSSVHFQIIEEVLLAQTVAFYSPEDYTLTLGPAGRIPANLSRLSIDQLTLSFSRVEKLLIALDAYTNFALWHREPLVLPPVDLEAGLVCTEAFDENEIAQAASDLITYRYSEENDLLVIQFTKDKVVKRVRCLSRLVCGLGPESTLAELWVEGIQFR